jgi:hypothetical protein
MDSILSRFTAFQEREREKLAEQQAERDRCAAQTAAYQEGPSFGTIAEVLYALRRYNTPGTHACVELLEQEARLQREALRAFYPPK